jgi:phage portal protein BeeE
MTRRRKTATPTPAPAPEPAPAQPRGWKPSLVGGNRSSSGLYLPSNPEREVQRLTSGRPLPSQSTFDQLVDIIEGDTLKSEGGATPLSWVGESSRRPGLPMVSAYSGPEAGTGLPKSYPGMRKFLNLRVLAWSSTVVYSILTFRRHQVTMREPVIVPAEREASYRLSLLDYSVNEVPYLPALDEAERHWLTRFLRLVDTTNHGYSFFKEHLYEAQKGTLGKDTTDIFERLQEKHRTFHRERNLAKRDILRLLKRPDTHGHYLEENSWYALMSSALEDLLVIDRGVIYKKRDAAGKLEALIPLDGATIEPVLDDYGYVQRYCQVVDGMPVLDIPKKDLILLRLNHTTDTYMYGYGLPPMEVLYNTVLSDLFIDKGNLAYYQKGGSIPEGIIVVHPPGDGKDGVYAQPEPEVVESIQRNLTAVMMGDYTNVPLFTGGKLEFIDFKGKRKDMQFKELAEYLTRKICAVFQVSPQDVGVLGDINRATAEQQAEATQSKGLETLLNTVGHALTRGIVDEYRPEGDLKLWFKEETKNNSMGRWQVVQGQLQSGYVSINQAKVEDGEDPVPWGDTPLQGLRNWKAEDPNQAAGGAPGVPGAMGATPGGGPGAPGGALPGAGVPMPPSLSGNAGGAPGGDGMSGAPGGLPGGNLKSLVQRELEVLRPGVGDKLDVSRLVHRHFKSVGSLDASPRNDIPYEAFMEEAEPVDARLLLDEPVGKSLNGLHLAARDYQLSLIVRLKGALDVPVAMRTVMALLREARPMVSGFEDAFPNARPELVAPGVVRVNLYGPTVPFSEKSAANEDMRGALRDLNKVAGFIQTVYVVADVHADALLADPNFKSVTPLHGNVSQTDVYRWLSRHGSVGANDLMLHASHQLTSRTFETVKDARAAFKNALSWTRGHRLHLPLWEALTSPVQYLAPGGLSEFKLSEKEALTLLLNLHDPRPTVPVFQNLHTNLQRYRNSKRLHVMVGTVLTQMDRVPNGTDLDHFSLAWRGGDEAFAGTVTLREYFGELPDNLGYALTTFALTLPPALLSGVEFDDLELRMQDAAQDLVTLAGPSRSLQEGLRERLNSAAYAALGEVPDHTARLIEDLLLTLSGPGIQALLAGTVQSVPDLFERVTGEFSAELLGASLYSPQRTRDLFTALLADLMDLSEADVDALMGSMLDELMFRAEDEAQFLSQLGQVTAGYGGVQGMTVALVGDEAAEQLMTAMAQTAFKSLGTLAGLSTADENFAGLVRERLRRNA